MRHIFSVITFTMIFSFSAFGKDESNITITKLSKHIYKITAVERFDVNFVASIGPDGILLVDTGFKSTAEELQSALRAISKAGVKFVINSHGHIDHTGGNSLFGKDATIISHVNLPKKINKGPYILEEHTSDAYPEWTIESTMKIYFNGEEIRVFSLPGSHDNDDLMVHFTESKIAYMGDIAYGLNYPTYDAATADATLYAEVVKRAIALLPNNTLVVSGHGKDCTMKEMREYQKMLAETTRIVLEEVAKGKTADDIPVEMLGPWAEYGGQYQGAKGWIRALVESAMRIDEPVIDTIKPMYLERKENGIHAAIYAFNEIQKTTDQELYLDLYIFGTHLLKHEEWNDALQIFELANSAYPDNPYFWYFLFLQGEAHLGAGNIGAAIEKFEACLHLNPDHKKSQEMLDKLTGGK